MSNLNGINGFIKEDKSYLSENQAVPQNTSADGNGEVQEVAGTNGSLEVVVECSEAITITSAKVLSIKIQDSNTSGSGYADLATIYSATAPTFAAGDVIARYTLPEGVKNYIKAVLTTDDASAAGKLNIFTHYVPR